MKPIIYVAHPVSTGDPLNNAHRAVRWVKAFVDRDPRRIYIAPWVAEVIGFAVAGPMSSEFYQRVLDDDCDVVQRLDGIVGVGGEGWTKGMSQERATARAHNKPILDWTRFSKPEDVLKEVWASMDLRWAEVTPNSHYYAEPS